MIEKTVYDYLAASLSVKVVTEIPDDMKESTFVKIEKTGSGQENKINSATVVIQSYAPTLFETAQLNEEVKAAMDAMPDTQNVSRCRLNSDYNFTDTARKRHRYQAVYDITY